MAFSLNKVCLIGNIGQDAEHRFTTNNNEVTSFSLATTESYKGKDGNWVNNTSWHKCVLFGASDHQKGFLKKGKKIYLEGELNYRNYENKEGQKVYITEIKVNKYSLIPLDDSKDKPEEEFNHFPKLEINKPDEDDDLPF